MNLAKLKFWEKTSIFPPHSWHQTRGNPSDYTGDIWLLEQSEFQLMLICDQMMQNQRMNTLLQGYSTFLGAAFTAKNNFILWKKKLGLGTYPIPLREQYPKLTNARTPMTARIKGELFKIRSSRFLELDEYKSNGLEFRRQRVQLLVPYRRQQGSTGVNAEEFIARCWAWMYVGKKTYWEEHLDAGYMFGRCQIYELNNRYSDGVYLDRYYTFTPKEYGD